MLEDKNHLLPESENNGQPAAEQSDSSENKSADHTKNVHNESAGNNAEPEGGGCINEEKAAEFAESLTPGEEVLFTESEKTASEIASESSDHSPDKDRNMPRPSSEDGAIEDGRNHTEPETEHSPGFKYYLRVAGTLAVICACIAVLLAFVNGVTSERISENNRRAAEEAIQKLFADFDSSLVLEGQFKEPVTNITVVSREGDAIGYCVFVRAKGFSGAISVTVGINTDGTVKGIEILSMSETPGLGTQVKKNSFLSQFKGVDANINLDKVDVVAGATVSSKAVYSAVKSALDAVLGLPDLPDLSNPDEAGEDMPSVETDETAGATKTSIKSEEIPSDQTDLSDESKTEDLDTEGSGD